ncbi:protein kinase domain-containing protein [Nevskia ramosa]|uniref:serine/threonine-protein kinase n=2 Tax=Nevskia ramosa TaxID=64002 RepID=UPI003D14401D
MIASLSDLPAERWPKFSTLLDELLDLPAEAREPWLQQLSDEHADLAPLLRTAALEHAEVQARPPADQPRLREGPAGDPWTFTAARRIGPYELLTPLGQGGMGEVWSARRIDGSLNREVALKLPHTWLLSAGARLRLNRERDILAGLSHPNVAQLYDAGIADDGQPWMALEKVDGQRIDAWCRERRLPIAARLHLFMQVLDAVSAAHARLIVHRDLKPSNILVTDDGRAKLLDFGIAKLIDDDGRGDLTEITRLAGRSATPEYAAPEQLAGDTVTAATDVYSLGVVLHELLCGRRPGAPRGRAGADEQGRGLASNQTISGFAREVGEVDAKALGRVLQGDLDAILAKALSRRPEARYSSVERMADDLRRHLAHQPIEARHITRVERGLKFVRRHRLAIASATLLSLSIAVGGAVSLWQAQRAKQAASLAMSEASRANATRDFLLKVLGASGRLVARDRPAGSITAREMLDLIVDDLDGELKQQPETRLELLELARKLYRQWFDLPRVEQANQRYRLLVAELHGRDDPRLLGSLIEQANAYIEHSDFSSGLPLLDEAAGLIRSQGLAGSPVEAQWLMAMARHHPADTGDAQPALSYLQKAAAIYASRAPQDSSQRWPRFHLAQALAADGQLAEARRTALESIAMEQRRPDRNDWFIAWQTVELAHYERRLGHRDAARKAYEDGEKMVLATFGRTVDTQLEAVLWRATLMHWAGDDAGAEALFTKENGLLEAPPDPGNSDEPTSSGEGGAWFRLAYGRFLLDQGRAAAALPLLQRASTVAITSKPVELRQADAVLALGEALAALGRDDEAGQQFAAAHEAYRKLGRPGIEAALDARARWAQHLAEHGDPSLARAEFAAVLLHADGRALPAVAEAQMGLAELDARRDGISTALPQAEQALRTLDQVQALYAPQIRVRLQARFERLKAAPAK